MATHDAGSPTLVDFDVDPDAVASDHDPSLRPDERFVRCRDCGVSVPYSVTAEGPIRRALAELDSAPCSPAGLPDVPVGDHVPMVTAEHPTRERRVVCASCGREASLRGDRTRVFRDLAAIPCVDGLSYTELVDLVCTPTGFTPHLADLGISNWYALAGANHGEDVRQVFRHDRHQYATYVLESADGTLTAALTPAPNRSCDPVAELRFPSVDPAHPATREMASTLVSFFDATDPLSAGEFDALRSTYEDAFESHRRSWLDDAYARARERFRDSFDGRPASFAESFAESVDDVEEVLRRMVGSGGFDDVEEAAFAREMLGHDHEFPGFVGFVADRHDWSPPVYDP